MSARILIVEDEAIVGLDLAMQLQDEGYNCVGPVGTVAEALLLIEDQPPDLAVLDANLHGTTSAEVAEKLQTLNRPFVYVSGYGERGVLEELPRAPLLSKPLKFDRLSELIRELLAR